MLSFSVQFISMTTVRGVFNPQHLAVESQMTFGVQPVHTLGTRKTLEAILGSRVTRLSVEIY